MAAFIVGFDGKWQEKFDLKDEAVEWAREVAATGRTVEVIRRRFGFCSFLTGFPDSERAALEARWRRPVGLMIGASASGAYGSAYGGGHGGGHGGHGGHGGC